MKLTKVYCILLFCFYNCCLCFAKNHLEFVELNTRKQLFERNGSSSLVHSSSADDKLKELLHLVNTVGSVSKNVNPTTDWTSLLEIFNRNIWLPTLENITKNLIDFKRKPEYKCLEDIWYVFKTLPSMSSVQMWDASARIPSGILRGNGQWLGNYEECLKVHIQTSNRLETRIDGTYCTATWFFNFTRFALIQAQSEFGMQKVPLRTAVCLPQSCSDSLIEASLKKVVNSNIVHLESFKCEVPQPPLSIAAIIVLCILCAYLLFVSICTMLTIIDYLQCELPNPAMPAVDVESFSTFVNDKKTPPDDLPPYEEKIKKKSDCPGFVYVKWYQRPIHFVKSEFQGYGNFLKCFCFLTNCHKILNTQASDQQLMSIHGIRFLSMAWVILGHSYEQFPERWDNYLDVYEGIKKFTFLTVIQAMFAVDTFFFLGGFLLGYLYLEAFYKSKENGNFVNLFYIWIHRLIRISPVYLLLLAIHIYFLQYFVWGPFSSRSGSFLTSATQKILLNCPRNWWWNLLYINNFQPRGELCLGYTWYLANDMQFFILGTILVYILCRWYRIGMASISALMVSSWGLTFYMYYSNDILPVFVFLQNPPKDTGEFFDKIIPQQWNMYTKPYYRVPTYLIGLMFAYLLINKLPAKPMKMKFRAIGWLCSGASVLTLIYGVYHMQTNVPPVIKFFYHCYSTFARSIYTLGIVWVLYCCLTSNANLVNRLLSLKVWIPLSRLSYCAYLFHPVVIRMYGTFQQETVAFSHLNMVMLYFGFMVVTYALALVISAIFESPTIQIEKILRKKHLN